MTSENDSGKTDVLSSCQPATGWLCICWNSVIRHTVRLSWNTVCEKLLEKVVLNTLHDNGI